MDQNIKKKQRYNIYIYIEIIKFIITINNKVEKKRINYENQKCRRNRKRIQEIVIFKQFNNKYFYIKI